MGRFGKLWGPDGCGRSWGGESALRTGGVGIAALIHRSAGRGPSILLQLVTSHKSHVSFIRGRGNVSPVDTPEKQNGTKAKGCGEDSSRKGSGVSSPAVLPQARTHPAPYLGCRDEENLPAPMFSARLDHSCCCAKSWNYRRIATGSTTFLDRFHF